MLEMKQCVINVSIPTFLGKSDESFTMKGIASSLLGTSPTPPPKKKLTPPPLNLLD